MKSRLILVACATDIFPSLSTNLAAGGCRVQCASSALELLRKARRRQPDLIILDAPLPDMDVTTLCDILSRLPSTRAVPRLQLAARAEAFCEAAPSMGAPGERPAPPFNSQELMGRVNEMLGVAALAPSEMAGQDAA